MVGHNLFACDANLLYAQCSRCSLDFEQLVAEAKVTAWVDTLSLARVQPELTGLQSKALGDVYAHVMSKPMPDAHDAAADAKATMEILQTAGFVTQLLDSKQKIGRRTDGTRMTICTDGLFGLLACGYVIVFFS